MGGVGTFCCRLQRNCLQLQKASLSPFHPLQVLCPAALQLLCFHSQHWALECLIFTEFQSFSFLALQDLIYPVQFRPKTGGYGHDATEGMAHVEKKYKKEPICHSQIFVVFQVQVFLIRKSTEGIFGMAVLPLAAFHPPLVCELLNPRFAAGARHRGGRFLPGTIQGGLFANNYPVAGVRIFLPPLAGNKLICICELASSCICKQGNATKSRWTPGGG